MNKQGLASKVAAKKDITKKEALELVEVVFQSALEGLIEEGKVDLGDLGKLEKVLKPARTARNPQNGAEVAVPEKNAPRYKPGKAIKEALNK